MNDVIGEQRRRPAQHGEIVKLLTACRGDENEQRLIVGELFDGIEQSTEFAVLTGLRTAATLVARLVLIDGFGQGVFGFVVADVIVTAIFTLILAPKFAPFIRLMFSWDLLREALRFGLPRLPHGLAQQAMAVLDRYLLGLFAGLRDVGLYSIGASFGAVMARSPRIRNGCDSSIAWSRTAVTSR